MELINGKIRLTDLAKELGVTSQNLRLSLKNKSGLGEGVTKLGSSILSDYLLTIDSTLNFINWSYNNGKKLDYETLHRVEEMVKQLK